jgi:hypothetical protein
MSDAEEARTIMQYMREKGCSVSACALALSITEYKIRQAIAIHEGYPDVLAAFEEGKISAAQAVELQQFTTDLHAGNALQAAIVRQLSAKSLRIWREQIVIDGVDVAVAQVQEIIRQNPGINYRNMQQCSFCQQWFDYSLCGVYAVCHEDIDVLREIYQHYLQSLASQQEGGQNGETREGDGGAPAPGSGCDYYGLAYRS